MLQGLLYKGVQEGQRDLNLQILTGGVRGQSCLPGLCTPTAHTIPMCQLHVSPSHFGPEPTCCILQGLYDTGLKLFGTKIVQPVSKLCQALHLLTGRSVSTK